MSWWPLTPRTYPRCSGPQIGLFCEGRGGRGTVSSVFHSALGPPSFPRPLSSASRQSHQRSTNSQMRLCVEGGSPWHGPRQLLCTSLIFHRARPSASLGTAFCSCLLPLLWSLCGEEAALRVVSCFLGHPVPAQVAAAGLTGPGSAQRLTLTSSWGCDVGVGDLPCVPEWCAAEPVPTLQAWPLVTFPPCSQPTPVQPPALADLSPPRCPLAVWPLPVLPAGVLSPTVPPGLAAPDPPCPPDAMLVSAP